MSFKCDNCSDGEIINIQGIRSCNRCGFTLPAGAD